MCWISLSWARFKLKFLCTLREGICSSLWDCAASFTAQIPVPCPHIPYDFCKLWRNTVCRSVISFQFSSSWPSPLVNSLHAVPLGLVKLSSWSSKPAFAINPKSQINNLKICSSLSRRKCHAGATCLVGWGEDHCWAALSCPGIWVGSRHTSGEGGSAVGVSGGRVLSESSDLLCGKEIRKYMNLNDTSFSYRVTSPFMPVSPTGYCFPAQRHDLILCKALSP